MLDRRGYRRKEYSEILDEMSDRAKQLFGENTNVTERSIMGILLRIMAWFLSLVWKDNEDTYYSAYPGTATGVQLDRVMPYAGITRHTSMYAIGQLEVTGLPGYEVPAGFKVAAGSNRLFATTQDVLLDEHGKAVVEIQALDPGPDSNVAAGAINEMVDILAQVDSVNNPAETTGGRNQETDQEARERFYAAREGLGSRTAPSVRSALLALPGVRAARVKNNPEETKDEYGTPPHAFQTFVLGGTDEQVAQVIMETKPLGVRPFGSTEVKRKDNSGSDQIIGFTRAVEVPVTVRITVETDATFPADGEEQIRSSIVRYVGGMDRDGTVYNGLNMGEPVVISRLINRVYQTEGIKDVKIEVAKSDGIYKEANLLIDILEVAQVNYGDIEVIVHV